MWVGLWESKAVAVASALRKVGACELWTVNFCLEALRRRRFSTGGDVVEGLFGWGEGGDVVEGDMVAELVTVLCAGDEGARGDGDEGMIRRSHEVTETMPRAGGDAAQATVLGEREIHEDAWQAGVAQEDVRRLQCIFRPVAAQPEQAVVFLCRVRCRVVVIALIDEREWIMQALLEIKVLAHKVGDDRCRSRLQLRHGDLGDQADGCLKFHLREVFIFLRKCRQLRPWRRFWGEPMPVRIRKFCRQLTSQIENGGRGVHVFRRTVFAPKVKLFV